MRPSHFLLGPNSAFVVCGCCLQGSNLATVARALTLHCPLPLPPREELPYASMSDVGGVPAVPLNALLGLVAIMGGGSSQAKLQLGFWALDR